MNQNSLQITELLMSWSNGEEMALEQLMPVVYDELRRIARRLMRGQNSEHTYQTTDLIHEAYLKLVDNNEKQWQNRAHFFGVASRAMRHILVDYARAKQSQKRGGKARAVTLDETAVISNDVSGEIVALNAALENLGKLDGRKVQVVEMKFFGGLTTEEIAEVLKMSPETVKRDWRFARTWLRRELAG
ncbi:MAG: sigma-70 family RNA polymerase sigma factor [Acidobacteria bacterium]|nr:sigma-70 family RNA polymerase sigma factor [Acidobacteriota bacterium]MBK8149261.1 sigma-70 family RNA polymerase sigma factor [Acidobacteriota bacterium]MBK8811186.1 sigma-70 family RNA polymerase sigma factor [Acidobacteriota bacterium]